MTRTHEADKEDDEDGDVDDWQAVVSISTSDACRQSGHTLLLLLCSAAVCNDSGSWSKYHRPEQSDTNTQCDGSCLLLLLSSLLLTCPVDEEEKEDGEGGRGSTNTHRNDAAEDKCAMQ